jgi:DNA-binding HxlR family transcriptional regulator
MSYNRALTLNCESNPNADCAVEAALAILGGKWKLKIYKAEGNGSGRVADKACVSAGTAQGGV